MIRRRKQKESFDSEEFLMSPSWELWDEWNSTTSVRQKQMYFDSKIGNIYHHWHLHFNDREALNIHPVQYAAMKRQGLSPSFKLHDPAILISVKITRDNYVITTLPLKEGKTMTFRHKRHNLWFAKLYLKV